MWYVVVVRADANRVRVAPDENDTIYVSGLPTTIDEDQIKSFFGSIGVIRVRPCLCHLRRASPSHP